MTGLNGPPNSSSFDPFIPLADRSGLSEGRRKLA